MPPTQKAASDLKRIQWLLLLIPLVSIGVAIVVGQIWPEPFRVLKPTLETPAPFLIGFVALVYAARSLVTRNHLYIVLTALAMAFTLREIHWRWTHKGIYIMLAVIGVWAALWHNKLREPLRDWRHTSWVIATFFAYFFSQVIARRAFKFIPGEADIHIPLEEWAETTAHAMLLVTCLVGSWRNSPPKPAEPAPPADPADQ